MSQAVRGGDIRGFTWYGRSFDPAGGDGNVNIDLGGYTNEAAPTGNGALHVNQRRKLAGFSDMAISVDDARQDIEFLQGKANAGVPGPCTLTLASGIVYSGNLLPIGELAKAGGDGRATLEGRGMKFEQI